ncbi:hypothetical protein QJQ45_024408 [Haematococcus lacustris]|nr:hypothetical protein QJQ45_024408 [Haematococcus lacustris]
MQTGMQSDTAPANANIPLHLSTAVPTAPSAPQPQPQAQPQPQLQPQPVQQLAQEVAAAATVVAAAGSGEAKTAAINAFTSSAQQLITAAGRLHAIEPVSRAQSAALHVEPTQVARSNVRVTLPVIKKWSSKDLLEGRDFDMFVTDVRRYASALNQELTETLLLHSTDDLRQVVGVKVSQAHSQGKAMTADEVIVYMKELIGYHLHDTKHIAMNRLVQAFAARNAQGMSVSDDGRHIQNVDGSWREVGGQPAQQRYGPAAQPSHHSYKLIPASVPASDPPTHPPTHPSSAAAPQHESAPHHARGVRGARQYRYNPYAAPPPMRRGRGRGGQPSGSAPGRGMPPGRGRGRGYPRQVTWQPAETWPVAAAPEYQPELCEGCGYPFPECQCPYEAGATYTILSEKLLNTNPTADVTLAPLEHKVQVLAANNVVLPITSQVHGMVCMQKSLTPVVAKILPQMLDGIDLILGADWQKSHNALLDVSTNICHIQVQGKKHKLHSQHLKFQPGIAVLTHMANSNKPVEQCSAQQAARALRKGCPSVLVLVQPDDGDADQGWHSGTLASVIASSAKKSKTEQHVHGLMPQSEVDALVHDMYPEVFQDMPSGLPPDRGVGHTIRMVPDHVPPYQRSRRYTLREMNEMKKQVAELLAKKLIEPSCSPYGAPVLFVEKRDGILRMCVDYRALNKLTVRDRYPLPRIDDLFDKLQGKIIFSSLDLQSGYHRITPEDMPKTAFVTPEGQFQYKVLSFGLTNAPATFQRVMNRVFEKQLKEGFVLVYLDDILVMSSSPEEHAMHFKEVLQVMKDNQLYAKLSKCDFNRPELKFLGHIVGRQGIAVDPAKVQVIKEWPVPTSLKELQAFLGLANFFRRFIAGYSTIAAPLTHLTGEKVAAGTNWQQLGEPALRAFNALKQALCSTLVLALPDPNQPFEVWSDASLVGTGGVLLQGGRVVAYTSHKFSPAQMKYTTGEQELLGIIRALQEWRCYLDGAVHVTIVTDHNPLIYLKTQTNLSRRQARWMEFLARFNHHIEYKSGKGNVADPLSRNPALTYQMTSTGSDDDDGEPIMVSVGAALCVSGVYALVLTRRQAGLLQQQSTR